MMGIACFLVIALYIFDELTFDSFHRNAENIYRVVEERTSETGTQTKVASVSYQVAQQAPAQLPGVVRATRISVRGRVLVKSKPGDKGFQEENWIVHPDFLKMFDFKMLFGDRATALDAPKSLVITAETAIKYFGTTDVVGKTLSPGRDTNFCNITGVLENFPANSHIRFNMMTGESSMTGEGYKNFINNDWSSNAFFTFIQIDPTADPNKLSKQLEQMLVAQRKDSKVPPSKIFLQPLKQIHFYSGDIESASARTGIRPGGNIMQIYIFSIVAIFVLVIACINYINLTTARFSNRAKEIAVRKVVGAERRSIIFQFLSEAMLMTLIALVLAIVMVKLALPFFNQFSGKDLQLGFDMDYRIGIGIVCIALLVGILSGIYPAFIQSRFRAFTLLKSKVSFGKGSLSIRQSLVVFQFTLSIIIIVATIVVYQQLKYVNTKDMGFKKDQLVVIDINSGAVRRAAPMLKSEYEKIPGVTNVCASSRVPGEWKVLPKVKVQHQADAAGSQDMYFIGADASFLETFAIKTVSGRNFINNGNADSTAIIINETAAKLLGISSANEQIISIPSTDWGGDVEKLDEPFVARVIGIVKDFNFRSLHEPIAPLVISYQNNPIHPLDYYTAKVSPENLGASLKRMEEIMRTVDRGHLFEYNFLDNQWNLFYKEDQKRQTIFLGIAIMTILVACLGLFGLVTYAAERRIKEIGIRKVLGASVGGIVSLLSVDFIKLVGIAAIIALPVSWWAMNEWLQNFAYRINIEWWIFLMASILAMLVAVVTVGLQAIKVAIANPIKALRSE